jgi:hypothetical protein
MEIQEGDPDAAGEEKQEDAEQEQAEADVLPGELGIHQPITASTARAAKSSAR